MTASKPVSTAQSLAKPASASALARGSANTQRWAELCAVICEACAAEWDKHDMEECRRCAEECRRVAQAA